MITWPALGAPSRRYLCSYLLATLRFCMGMTIEFSSQFSRSASNHANGAHMLMTQSEVTFHVS
jgi:hypothetical protein